MNVVFDLGGVVVTWEPLPLLRQVFSDPSHAQTVHDAFVGSPDWVAMDRGVMDQDTAARNAAERTGMPREKIQAFMDIIPPSLVPIDETLQLVRDVRATGNRTLVLSNMPFPSIEHIEREHGFWEHFDDILISCRLGMVKPEADIYRHLLGAHGLKAEETVFIDDTEINLIAAAEEGIRTVLFRDAGQCRRELVALGCV